MKTVFKKGMEVYDQLMFPDIEGVVSQINDDEYEAFPIKVRFRNSFCYYTKDGRTELYNIPTLATKPYKVILEEFEQKASISTYEEALDWLEKNSKNRVIYADEAYINEEYENAFEALRKLVILRDYYNKGWQPDWSNNHTKYCIELEGLDICSLNHCSDSRVMAFKTEEIRDKFLEEQKELLEIAKPLL